MRTMGWILGVWLCAASAVAQPFETVDELAEAFVRSLRKMETTEFRKLYTQDTLLVSNLNQNLGFPFQDSLILDFTRIVQKGASLGIDWSKVRFIKAEYITQTDGPFLIAQPTVIVFQHRLFRYAVEMNCSKINGSWGFVPIQRQRDWIYMKKI